MIDLDEIERCARYVEVPEDPTKRRQAFNDYFMAVDPNTILAMIAELRANRAAIDVLESHLLGLSVSHAMIRNAFDAARKAYDAAIGGEGAENASSEK